MISENSLTPMPSSLTSLATELASVSYFGLVRCTVTASTALSARPAFHLHMWWRTPMPTCRFTCTSEEATRSGSDNHNPDVPPNLTGGPTAVAHRRRVPISRWSPGAREDPRCIDLPDDMKEWLRFLSEADAVSPREVPTPTRALSTGPRENSHMGVMAARNRQP
jgi:hypothetical protein